MEINFSAIFEHSSLATFQWSVSTLLEYGLYTVCMFSFYSLVSMVMAKTSALMSNLAVLSSDFYSLLAGIFIFSYSVSLKFSSKTLSFILVQHSLLAQFCRCNNRFNYLFGKTNERKKSS